MELVNYDLGIASPQRQLFELQNDLSLHEATREQIRAEIERLEGVSKLDAAVGE